MKQAVRLIRAAGGLALVCLFACAWVAAGLVSRGLADGVARSGWAVLLAAFGIRVRVRGTPRPGALLVANHVSWIDIPVLARLTGAAFVAKDAVRGWPVIGWLAQRLGCAFVDRAQPRDVARQTAQLARAMAGNGALVLFPEGTTSDGTTVLPFRTSLFAAVQAVACAVVQPVALVIKARDGTPLAQARRPGIAWLDDADLLPHAFALAARGGAMVEVWFEPPVPPGDRKVMADACRRAILARVAPDGQTAMLNRAA